MSTISPNTLLHDTSRRSQIMIAILKLEKHLSMGLGTLTLKDQQLDMMFLIGVDMVLVLLIRNCIRNLIFLWRALNGLLQWCSRDKYGQEKFHSIALLDL